MIDNPIYDFRNKNSNKSNDFINELNESLKQNKSEEKIEFDFGGFTYSLENQDGDMIFKISDGNETAILPGKYFKAFANQFDDDFRKLVKAQVKDYVEKSNAELTDYEVIDSSITEVSEAKELEENIPRRQLSKEEIELNNIKDAKELMTDALSLESLNKILVNTIGKNSKLVEYDNAIVYSNDSGVMTLELNDDTYRITGNNNISDNLSSFILDAINKNITSLKAIDNKIQDYTADVISNENIEKDPDISR